MEEAIRWNIRVSKETDLALRAFLDAQGGKQGDRAEFIEDAVRWRLLQRTVQDIRRRNAGADPAAMQRTIDEAVSQVRAQRRARHTADKA